MTTAKHTPGPWRAVDGEVVKAGRFNVCPHVTAGGSARGMIDEREVMAANAHLIAAAPDLLAACQLQHAAIDMLMAMLIEAKTGFMPTKSPVWPAVIAGSAAIAKATAP